MKTMATDGKCFISKIPSPHLRSFAIKERTTVRCILEENRMYVDNNVEIVAGSEICSYKISVSDGLDIPG
jgi:hypothetical protein